MARDRLMMGVALVALTASIVWAGRWVPFESPSLSSLVVMHIQSDSGLATVDDTRSNDRLTIGTVDRFRCRARNLRRPPAPATPIPPATPPAGI